MSPSELLVLAGDAAGILETMGYVAVARLSEGVVTLEVWRVVDRQKLRMRHVVDASVTSSTVLAQSVAVEFRARYGLSVRGVGVTQ
jgi:uncharacterized membrane protein